ncbi:MAG: NAD(P)-dependent oxidoreductase [Bacteroidia bacterium]
MHVNKILLIDTIHPLFKKLVEEKGFVCEDGTAWSKEETLQRISEYNGAVIRSRFLMDKELLDAAQNLKFIARAGAGMENIDVDYAKSKGIACLNSPEGNRDAVGEFAIGHLLSFFRKINKADSEVRKGTWLREENRGVELQGKTVAIIGFGNMGSAFAKKLSGFEVNILAYDKYISIDSVKYSFVKQVAMERIFDETDIISFHIPLTEETRYLVHDDFINCFRKNIYIINTSRGKILNTADLVKNMKTGKVKGACLDVSEYESTSFENFSEITFPEPMQYLVNAHNVILSPHIAGWTFESNEKMARILAEKVIAL